MCKVYRTVECQAASSLRCLAALAGEGKRTGQGGPLPQPPSIGSQGHPLPLDLSRQWAFHSGTSLLDWGQPLGRRLRPARAPIAPSGEGKAGRRPRLIPLALCPPTSPRAGPTLPVSPRRREVALSESLRKRWGWLAGQGPLTPAPLLLHHSAFILPGPGQAPPGVGSV